ncbi:hypothetical protein J2129_002302 [Methanofollis sp. W23]|nr:hypothetical protein [Methanofollis sp. W23]
MNLWLVSNEWILVSSSDQDTTGDHHFVAAPTYPLSHEGSGRGTPQTRDSRADSTMRAARPIIMPSHTTAPGARPPEARE